MSSESGMVRTVWWGRKSEQELYISFNDLLAWMEAEGLAKHAANLALAAVKAMRV